ncbi:uncharacterized protein B0H64DRAFT_447154 [Chaetomium fimeti]|uniref:Glycosyl transferase n=1 Tax=Chaetomium fimeti TaxID=1854472 RepID=A0AAE0H5T7_9PEZI|nr:hypothetical protein B0H64DRAFT_447154 [Chaetomium fimeti]
MFLQTKPLTTQLALKLAAAASVFLALLFFFLPHDATSRIISTPRVDLTADRPSSPAPSGPPPTPRDVIPNTVHFVYILPDGADNFNFQFSHFLSLYAAWHHWRPDTIYLHTNVDTTGPEIARARNGTAGKWNGHIFSRDLGFDLRVNTVPVPTHAGNGMELQNMEHRSDFVRVKAVHDLGGVYIDWDVHALRDLRPLRESGFRAVAGRQLGGQINSGTFLSTRAGRMIALWMDGMHKAYTGGWTTHSNEVITRVGQRLVRDPAEREMLIMEREAFAPGSWTAEDTDELFGVRNVTSNLANYTAGMALPEYEEEFEARWDRPEDFPDWERDWSYTYLLHAFTPDRWSHKVEGFEHITPRYVLERQSNFARAVYPIAKIMYDKGLIGVDDSHEG